MIVEPIRMPSKTTLKKYGLTGQDYLLILKEQKYCCPICGNPLTKRTNIDHFHVRNWKKLPDEERKKYVRGVCCFFCNKYYLGKAITVKKAQNVVTYLERFERRLNEV